MCGPSIPPPPDPGETAAAQTGTNISTATANSYLNNVNRVGPDGAVVYRQTGSRSITDPSTAAEGEEPKSFDVPTFTQKTILSKSGQRLQQLNNQTKENLGGLARDQSGMLRDHLGTPVNRANLPSAGKAQRLTDGIPEAGDASLITGGEETRARVEKALMERLNPQLSQDREALRTQLSNQGIKLGSEAYDRGFDSFGRQSNDARLSAILGAGQEASRVNQIDLSKFAAQNTSRDRAFGENLTGFNAQNTARARALNERMSMRNQPINEITALLSGSQVSQPNFNVPTVNSNIPTTDYAGLVNSNYQQQVAGANAKGAFMGDLLGGLFGAGGNLGAAGIAASDIRVKRDIEHIGEQNGFGVYRFRYTGEFDDGEEHVGHMAQEVMLTRPDAVHDIDGTLHVDYGRL